MSIIRNTETVDGATDLEIRAIWSERETVFLRASKTADSDIHLYKQCQAFPKDNYEPTEKDIAVYPRGFKDICKHCLFRWRQGKRQEDD